MKSDSQFSTTPKHSTQHSKAAGRSADTRVRGNFAAAKDDVFQLQRVIGNQAVQRLMGGSKPTRIPEVQRSDAPTEEKTSQGLLEDEATSRYAQRVYEWTQNSSNADKSLNALVFVLFNALNEELAAANVPAVTCSLESLAGADGNFRARKWHVAFDLEMIFGKTAQTVGDLNPDQLERAVGIVYHEGRHAEQFFLIARVRAAEMVGAGKSPDQIKKALVQNMELAERAAEQAAANPLQDADAETLNLIESFERSLFGQDQHYTSIIYGMFREVGYPIHLTAKAVIDLIPAGFETLPINQQNEIRARLGGFIPAMESQFVALQRYLDNELQPEVDRLLKMPIAVPPDNNSKMLHHLSALIGLTNSILRHRPLPSEPKAALDAAWSINYSATSIHNRTVIAGHDMPDQADAEKAERAAEKAFQEQDGE